MPDLTLQNGDINVKTSSGYHFSAVSTDDLNACEYTLVGIACDVSSSVQAFKQSMEKCLQQIVQACQKSPRADNLMLRFIQFANAVVETHGFKPLVTIRDDDYLDSLNIGGMTALFDSTYLLTESLIDYGKMLMDQDYDVNGIIFVITDGCDNKSKFTAKKIRKLKQRVLREECLESLLVVLIGVDTVPDIQDALVQFKNDADLDQFVDIGQARPENLAKLAAFVSQSISTQSQALNSGSSAILSF